MEINHWNLVQANNQESAVSKKPAYPHQGKGFWGRSGTWAGPLYMRKRRMSGIRIEKGSSPKSRNAIKEKGACCT